MSQAQKVIKYVAIAFAMLLIVGIISGIASGLYYIVGVNYIPNGSDGEGNMIAEKIDGEVSSLNIELKSVCLTVVTGESFGVETDSSHLQFSKEGETLKIKETGISFFRSGIKETLKITVPRDFPFADVKIDSGAGVVSVDTLSAERLDFEIGAGSVLIKKLNVSSSADIEGGAGKFTVESGEIRNADIDIGVGEFLLSARLTGSSKVDCGVGRTVLTLTGSLDDYSLHIKKGIGAASVGGTQVSDGARIGNGDSSVDISGGIGSIEILFSESGVSF